MGYFDHKSYSRDSSGFLGQDIKFASTCTVGPGKPGVNGVIGRFKYLFIFTLFVEDSHFDKYFSDGLKPPAKHGSIKSQNASHRLFFAATGGEDVKR